MSVRSDMLRPNGSGIRKFLGLTHIQFEPVTNFGMVTREGEWHDSRGSDMPPS